MGVLGIYESPEKYAEHLNMSLEQAKIRLEYFLKVKEEMKKTQRCPKCEQHTLAIEGGEWESGVSDWIYCENDKIELIDEEGYKYFEECDFTDDVKKEYLFAFEADFDVVLMMSCTVDITNDEEVLKVIGLSWKDFVRKDTEELLKVNQIAL